MTRTYWGGGHRSHHHPLVALQLEARVPWCRVSGFAFQVSGFRVLDVVFRVRSFGFRVPNFGFRVPGSGFRISSFEFRVPNFGFRIWVPGSGFRISGVPRAFQSWQIAARSSLRSPRMLALAYLFWGFGVWSLGVRFLVWNEQVCGLGSRVLGSPHACTRVPVFRV